ncbi:RNA polymerase sigma factor [Paenibacillus sepulcri]|uniref:RNA polymerase sigma factor n=1 Tax=Paenibacillus sepulcri TaxID=359917 RepID=A0ABS7C0N3_9BACL|nr:RNA polymerase sigma factor [Paenibacillus sepulcri]
MRPWAEFEDVITPHLNHLRTYCFYLTASHWEAEDLRQETLLRAFKHYRSKGDVQYPRSLLYKIARNVYIDAYRRRRGIMVPIDEAGEQSYCDENYASVRGLLEWVTEHLSEREVEMLLLAEVFRYSYQDIADELDCTVPAVKMVLHRSKQALRKRGAQHKATGELISLKPQLKPPMRMPRRSFVVDRWTRAVMNYESR